MFKKKLKNMILKDFYIGWMSTKQVAKKYKLSKKIISEIINADIHITENKKRMMMKNYK